MFGPVLSFELRNVIREKMTLFMLGLPFVMGTVIRLLIQHDVVHGQGAEVVAIVATLLAGFAYGALGGFSLLDDRDDQVLTSMQISPFPVMKYIWFKVCFVGMLAMFASFFMLWFTQVVALSVAEMVLISVLNSLQVPFVVFVINAFARNKIEGYVVMKATSFMIYFPAAGFFYLDAVEWAFGLTPAHWTAKALQHALLRPMIEAGVLEMNLSFYGYVGVGAVYNLLLVIGALLLFKRKNVL